MVGIVLVSHSRPLAEAAKELVQSMTGTALPLAVAAGAGEDHADLGTDAIEIAQAIQSVMDSEGVLVLMDLGSAVLSAETALELLDESLRPRVRLCAAPFVEGAMVAGVSAKVGQPLEQIAQEAEQALHPKGEHLRLEADQRAPPGEPAVPPTPVAAPGAPASLLVTVNNPHGLHARPAAHFVQESARFQADVRVCNATRGTGPVSARSLSALASLEVLRGHAIRVSATGPQATEALESIRALVESGLGDHTTPPPPASPSPEPPQREQRAQPVAEGIAIGSAIFVHQQPPAVSQQTADDPVAETSKLQAALAAVRASLLQQKQQAQRSAGEQVADILAAQGLLLEDPALLGRAEELIAREHANAALAWQQSVQELVARYQQFEDEYLRQRAADVDDVGRRVLAELGAKSSQSQLPLDQEGILVVDDLGPAQVPQLAGSRLSGVICLDGGRTSHSAILLRALGLPSLVQARPLLAELARGQGRRERPRLAFDGGSGEIWISPDAGQSAELTARRKAWQDQQARLLAAVHQPAVTTDGHRVELLANVGQLPDAEAAVRYGAEGIGLLRTEFLFLNRPAAPSESEQMAALEPIVQLLGGRPVVARTLDVGGDKDLPYLDLPREANPFLGVRAVRLCLRRPELFQTQLRALLRAGAHHDLRILFPMISQPAELTEAARQLELAHTGLVRESIAHAWPVRRGIMVEVPSAALLADELAQHCDFFSIGTNDLTQYALAADRGNPQLSSLQDALHPAVLRLIRQTVEAAHSHGKRVAVCGEAAGDVQAALVFVGLRVDELSVAPPAIPAVKAAIRGTSYRGLEDLAHQALQRHSAGDVRRLAAGLQSTTARG